MGFIRQDAFADGPSTNGSTLPVSNNWLASGVIMRAMSTKNTFNFVKRWVIPVYSVITDNILYMYTKM